MRLDIRKTVASRGRGAWWELPPRHPGLAGLVAGMVGLSVMLSVVSGRTLIWAEEASSSDATVTKTTERLHFKLPPDWPIEKRGGVTAPIPIEEYLAMKFKAVQSQMQTLEQRFNGFDVRLRALEEAAEKQKQGLHSGGSSAP